MSSNEKPMEVVAWREKVARIVDPHAFGLPVPGRGPLPGFVSNNRARDFNREGALTKADAILQALALIPQAEET